MIKTIKKTAKKDKFNSNLPFSQLPDNIIFNIDKESDWYKKEITAIPVINHCIMPELFENCSKFVRARFLGIKF